MAKFRGHTLRIAPHHLPPGLFPAAQAPGSFLCQRHVTARQGSNSCRILTISNHPISESRSNPIMPRCVDAESWKSSQVLAGSIVECLLIDYLTSRSGVPAGSKDPLKMDLAEAIAVCKAEGALSDRTADLCTVVKSYRNLIHPGRMVRLQESPPSKSSCDIAVALIELIVQDIAKTRRTVVGLTAEQIVSKLARDEGSLSILKHLLDDVREIQRIRLLSESLPEAYFQNQNNEDDPFSLTIDRFADAFRIIFDSVSDDIKKQVVANFVRLLREEDGPKITTYRRAFFRSGDLAYVNPPHQRW